MVREQWQKQTRLPATTGAQVTSAADAHPAAGPLAVLGGGVMGSCIAVMAAGHGQAVVLVEVDDGALARIRNRIKQHLRQAQLLSVFPAGRALAPIRTTMSIQEIAPATAVIEAVDEQVDRKRRALAGASEVVAPGTPLVSNTSGIPISEVADGLPRPADVAGTHFMNPAYLISTVEVVQGPRTSSETMAALQRLLTGLDRRPITVQDAPGFVTSRLLHPMLNDAARIVDAGIADAAAVDALMQGCLGHPTGPLRTADLIGLDNLADSLDAMHERTGDEHFRPCALLTRMVEKGHLGRKSGQGFYEYGEAFT